MASTTLFFDMNVFVFIFLAASFVLSFRTSIKSQGIYKSLIGISGIILVSMGFMIKDFIINNTMFYSTVLIVQILNYVFIIAGLSMVLISIGILLKNQ